MRRFFFVLIASALLGLLVGNPVDSASFPTVKGLNDPDVIACIQIKGPITILEKVSLLAKEMDIPMSLAEAKSKIGEPFGDPGLQNLDGAAVATIVLFDPNKFPEPVLYAKAVDPEKVAEFVRQSGLAAFTTGGYVVVSKTPQNLDKAGGLVPAVESLAKEETPGDIAFYFELSKILTIYKERIDQGIAQILMMTQMAGNVGGQPSWTTKMLELEILAYVDVARQVERLGITVGLEKDAIRLSTTIVALEGTPLASLVASGDGVSPEWDRFIPADSFLSTSMSFNPKMVMDFTKEEVRRITENRPADRESLLKLFDVIAFWTEVEKAAYSFGMVTTPETPMGIVGIMQTPGKQFPLEILSKVQDGLQAFQALTGEKEVPIKVVIEEKVREYKGVPITKMLFRVNPSAFPPDVFDQMKRIYDMIRYQVAVSGDYFVMAGSDDQMNQVLDQVLAEGTPPAARTLRARGYFPEGGALYADIDLGGYIKFLLEIVPETGAQLAVTSKTFEGVRQDPICNFIATQGKEAHAEVRIPTGPIIDVVNAVKQAFTTQPVK